MVNKLPGTGLLPSICLGAQGHMPNIPLYISDSAYYIEIVQIDACVEVAHFVNEKQCLIF